MTGGQFRDLDSYEQWLDYDDVDVSIDPNRMSAADSCALCGTLIGRAGVCERGHGDDDRGRYVSRRRR